MSSRLFSLIAAVLLVLAAAPAAHAATRHVVRGAGFGHGVGFSQYGGFGLAQEGRSYREILAHYYTDTSLSPADGRPVRVLLRTGVGETMVERATAAGGEELDPDRGYRVRRSGLSQVEVLTRGGDSVGKFDSPLRISSSRGPVVLGGRALNDVTGGAYHGTLEFIAGAVGGMTVVNELAMEDYLQGVVPGEIPASWPVEVLKAQAVAARSYALATRRGGEVFDQYPDTRSQVYKGVSAEKPSTNAAVRATAGEVLRHGGSVITAYYFSTSGGRTEDVQNVFYGAKPTPYLVSVTDPFDHHSPKHRWRFSFSNTQMQGKLSGLVKGKFRRVEVVRRGKSPRIVDAKVVGTRGSTGVKGATLRTKLGLFDTWATFTRVSSSQARPARGASWLERLGTPRMLVGEMVPRPRRGRLIVDRRTRPGAWRALRRARTDARGGFRVLLRRAGTYRVTAGGVEGPAVRIR